MKITPMKKLLFVAALVASVVSASAQFNSPPTGVNAEMLKMFGDTKAFSAKATARLLDKDQKETLSMPLTMALRDGKLRSELNMSEMQGQAIPAEIAGMMKQAGMDQMITIVLPEKKATVISYPGLKSYAEMPFTESEKAAGEKVEFTEVGKETIDGQACVKKKFTTTDSKGRTQDLFVWQATALKNFPIQMELPQRSNKLIVKFQTPKLETPDAALFDLPAGYTKYDNFQMMMQSAMMKMFSNGAK
jgi:Domain of unknown function (DUF4412)